MWRFVELDFDRLKLLHLIVGLGDFLFQSDVFWFRACGFLAIGCIECRQVTVDTQFNFFHSPLQFYAGGIAVAVVDGFEFTAFDGD
ncbi:hypothetical protein D3C75_656070 [compost metagenome]